MSQSCKSETYSVAEHKTRATIDPVHVQVGYMGLTVCATVVKATRTPGGGTFTLESASFGTRAFPARLVRKCSGLDGHCVCADEKPQA